MVASDRVGGPGKGIFQLLRYADPHRCSFLLCNFFLGKIDFLRNSTDSFEFFEMARAKGIEIKLLDQKNIIDPTLIGKAYRLIQREGINILETHSYKANILGSLLKLRYSIPWIAFAHGYTGGGLRLHLYNRIDQYCYQFADRVVVVSAQLKKLLLRRRVKEERIQLIHNAVDIEELKPLRVPAEVRGYFKAPASGHMVAVIGRLSPEKGQRTFLEALQMVVPQISSLRALIIGEGPDEKKLRALALELGIGEKVEFTGYRSDMPDIYGALDLVVIPSFSEGHPNVLLEAMACGVPVVSTDVGSVREAMGASGILVRPGEPAELATAILKILNNPDLGRKIRNAGLSEVKARFDPLRRAERLMALYEEVLDRHHTRH